MKEKLRIGLLMDSFAIPAWEYAMLQKIIESDFCEITLIVLSEARREEKENAFSTLRHNWSQLAYRAYQLIDTKIFKARLGAFRTKDSKDLLADIPTLKSTSPSHFGREDVTTIRGYNLDVLVQLSSNVPQGEIRKAARFGIWSYFPGDSRKSGTVPAGFWEVLNNHPTTHSTLRAVDKNGDQKVLYGSHSSTHGLSVNKNCSRHYWRVVSFLPRKLKELYTIGEELFFRKVEKENRRSDAFQNSSSRIPKNSELIVKLLGHLVRVANAWLQRHLFLERWILLFDISNKFSNSFGTYQKMVPPKDRLWADPHIIQRNGNYYIFFEEKLFETKKGHLSLIVMDEKGRYGSPVKIVDKPYHLSYPFVFEWRGEYYLIPESGDNRTIQLYKCTRFPDVWEFQHNLMDNVEAADATLFYYQQKWWLFASIKENEGYPNWDELSVFYSDSPLSKKWIPHPLNPVVSDVRRARPAGKIFQRDGNIYRPSQNSSKRYGYGLKFNRIVKLTETEYEEVEVTSIEPNWDKRIQATHSYCREGDLTVIDGMFKTSRMFA